MSKLNTFALLFFLTACGRQTVEFTELVDAAMHDAAMHDAALHDGTLVDGALVDGALVDGAIVDGSMIDGSMIDGPIADASLIDAGVMIDGPLVDGPLVDGPLIDGPQLDAMLQDGPALDASMCAQQTVPLGAAANFAVLAGSTVTNTGPTMVIGDLGVAPGTAVTGFPPGTVVGTTTTGPGSAAATGIADLTTAYNDAAGRTLCAVSVSGNLGGMTLTPGLYKSTSSLAISSGDLTLDGGGDSTAVFIFQSASTLTTTTGRKIILQNSANPQNIFWQVGSSATLGSNSIFYGTILADQSITLGTGAVVTGRTLAHIAKVALDSDMIVKP